MTEDPRVETIRGALRVRTTVDGQPTGALEALASLARDARKAALAEAVVRAAELLTRRDTFDMRIVAVREHNLADALAAFRTEFPADPKEKP